MASTIEHAEGDRIGPYELVRPLGSGGMGEVWEAVLHGPAGFVKPVAIKCLRPQRVADPVLLSALQHEARLGARLHHPNVVATLGLSEHEGVWVVALELVRGASIADVLRSVGPLPPRVVLDVAAQVAAGLAHVHAAGLVHRDVKPSNLLVDRTGLVKLADLGISSVAGEHSDRNGTYGYASPEQAEGHAEPRSDLFSLAVALVVLGTGRLPFGAGARAAFAIGKVEERIGPGGFVDELDRAVPGLGDVARRCLRFRPDDRYASARDLAVALEALRSRGREGHATLPELLARTKPSLWRDEPAGGVAWEALHEPTLVHGNVPPRRDRFVGRASELDELRRRVLGPGRILSVTGPGGVGKTRLVLETARATAHAFRAGAWAFDLAAARSVDGVVRAIARGLSIDLDATTPVEQLGRALAAMRRALFVLDNVEQCVGDLPATLGRWVDLAPEATFLCTSRLTLGLRGERSLTLGPLQPPDASALFVERASRSVTEQESPLVEPLCAMLEGMPLAIELAASRVKLLGVERIRSRLSLGLLSGGHADLPERHRSLEASLDWSAELLSPAGREGLFQLSVFDGGFEVEAAEAVLDVPGVSEVLGILNELVDASLVQVRPSGRFSMLAVVRDYSASRLSPGARDEAEVGHGRHFAQYGGTDALEAIYGRHGPARIRALVAELGNLLAAIRHAVGRGDAAVAVPTLEAAWEILRRQGPFEVAGVHAEAVSCMPDLGPGDVVRALSVLGDARTLQGRFAAARDVLERAVEVARGLDDPRRQGLLQARLAALCLERGSMDESVNHHEAALRLLRRCGDARGEANVLLGLGRLHHEQGRVTEAGEHYERARAVLYDQGDQSGEAAALSSLGRLHQDQGRLEEACGLYDRVLVLLRALGERGAEAPILSNLGLVHHLRGRTDDARVCYESALAIHRAMGRLHGEGRVLANLGDLDRELERVDDARGHYERALAIHRTTGARQLEGVVLGNLGCLLAGEGRRDEARACYEHALAIHRAVGNHRFEGVVLGDLGILHLMQDRVEDARACLERGLLLFGEVGDLRSSGVCMGWLARLAVRDGRVEQAHALLDEAEAAIRSVGDPGVLAMLLAARADIRCGCGDLEGARAALEEAQAVAPPGQPSVEREIARIREML